MKLRIETSQFRNSSFSFLRNQRQSESDFHNTIKKGVIYLHSWGTGHEELIFQNDEDAAKWWRKESMRLAKTT